MKVDKNNAQITKKSLIIFFIIICFTIVFLLIIKNNKRFVLECSADVTKVDGEAYESHTFYGNSKNVDEELLNVKLYISDEEIINNYKEIIENDSSCSEVTIYEDYITYSCSYNLLKEKFYDELKDDKGNISFSKIKETFENDNYVCNYK